jgi:ubiquinone/menaquinone biosynthesis C-methylase UbiE
MQWRDDEGVEAAAIAALVPLDGKRVLEVGCGKGRLTALAAARASSVYAFDPSAENVAASRAALTSEQRRRVRFAVHAAEALDDFVTVAAHGPEGLAQTSRVRPASGLARRTR